MPLSEMLVDPVHTAVGFWAAPFSSTRNLLCWMTDGRVSRYVTVPFLNPAFATAFLFTSRGKFSGAFAVPFSFPSTISLSVTPRASAAFSLASTGA